MKIVRLLVVSFIMMPVLIIGTVVIAEPVSAGIHLNTINPTATLRGDGHLVVVTGPIECDTGESLEVHIALTQASTGAIAEGSYHGRCLGDVEPHQQWIVYAPTHNGPALTIGSAEVNAWAETSAKGTLTGPRRSWGPKVVNLIAP